MGNHRDAVLGQEFPDTQGRLAWRIVMVQKPGTGRSFVRPFLTNFISKALQNGYVDSPFFGLVLGKKLVMPNDKFSSSAFSLIVKCWFPQITALTRSTVSLVRAVDLWIVGERAAIFKSGIPLICLGPTQHCFSKCLL
jgi:hypothetical protein